MAKYGTKQYWEAELHKEELKLELMCNGFAKVFAQAKSIAIEDVQAMLDVLTSCSMHVTFNKEQRDNAPYDKEEEEE